MDNLLPVLRNIVSYAIPIITCATVVVGGIWTLYKYFKEKNRGFYSEILAKVYEPLFTQLVKMEYSRKLLEESLAVKSEGGENSSRITLMQDGISNYQNDKQLSANKTHSKSPECLDSRAFCMRLKRV